MANQKQLGGNTHVRIREDKVALKARRWRGKGGSEILRSGCVGDKGEGRAQF